jgi:hypothetical protein
MADLQDADAAKRMAAPQDAETARRMVVPQDAEATEGMAARLDAETAEGWPTHRMRVRRGKAYSKHGTEPRHSVKREGAS